MTTEIRELPDPGKRVETGTVQFGNDWPGTFIRGDSGFGYLMYFKGFMAELTEEQKKSFHFRQVKDLFELISESNVSNVKPDLT